MSTPFIPITHQEITIAQLVDAFASHYPANISAIARAGELVANGNITITDMLWHFPHAGRVALVLDGDRCYQVTRYTAGAHTWHYNCDCGQTVRDGVFISCAHIFAYQIYVNFWLRLAELDI